MQSLVSVNHQYAVIELQIKTRAKDKQKKRRFAIFVVIGLLLK